MLLAREILHPRHQLKVALEVIPLEAGHVAPGIVGCKILEPAISSRQEAAPERTVGDKPNPEVPAGAEDRIFRITAPQRILRLQRANRVDGMGASEGGRCGFGE